MKLTENQWHALELLADFGELVWDSLQRPAGWYPPRDSVGRARFTVGDSTSDITLQSLARKGLAQCIRPSGRCWVTQEGLDAVARRRERRAREASA